MSRFVYRSRRRISFVASATVVLAVLFAVVALSTPARADEPEKLPEGMTIASLEVAPPSIDLSHPFAYSQ